MSICYNCDKEIVFGAQFCAECYQKLKLDESFIHEIKCLYCETKIPCTKFICDNCMVNKKP